MRYKNIKPRPLGWRPRPTVAPVMEIPVAPTVEETETVEEPMTLEESEPATARKNKRAKTNKTEENEQND